MKRRPRYPIKHWSHSSLMAFLRNPLAWHKRYVEEIRDMPSTPASIVGRAGHYALERFYAPPARPGGRAKEEAIAAGLDYLRNVGDSDIDFGAAKTRAAKRAKRRAMEEDYLRMIGFYLARPPRHRVLGAEVAGIARVQGLPLPVKAISDLVVESRAEPGAVDIVDHKFVASFSKNGAAKTLFVIQAIFNYYTVRELYGRPVRRFVVYECKKSKNKDGSAQMRRYQIDFAQCGEEFKVFHRLLRDATAEIARDRVYLPNPSDMFEGENSFDIYRLGLIDESA